MFFFFAVNTLRNLKHFCNCLVFISQVSGTEIAFFIRLNCQHDIPIVRTRFLQFVHFTFSGGGTNARICPTTWTDSKWRPVPSKRDGCLMPNLIGTCLCGAKNGKKICYRILDCREMGVEVLEVTIT